jgi:hypothetical protein
MEYNKHEHVKNSCSIEKYQEYIDMIWHSLNKIISNYQNHINTSTGINIEDKYKDTQFNIFKTQIEKMYDMDKEDKEPTTYFHKDQLNLLFVNACQENALPYVIYLWNKFGYVEAYDGEGYDDETDYKYHCVIELRWKRYMCIAMAIQSGSYDVLRWMSDNNIIHKKDYIYTVGLEELFYDMEDDIEYDEITQKVALWMFDNTIIPNECTPNVYALYQKEFY